MITRKPKVVAPVTPRIVHANPGQRLFRYGLLFCALLVTAWFSYDHGRSQAPTSRNEPVIQPGRPDGRLAELEQERDALKRQVAELEQNLEQERRTFEAERDRMRALQQAPFPQREVPAAEPETAAIAQEAADPALKLENVQITETALENVFRIAFSVTHDGGGDDRVTGTIWIAVNGTTNGKPTRLSLKMLSPERRSFVAMGFNLRQEITEEVMLPEDFLPRNILIEAKPYSKEYTGTSESLAWLTVG